jgi:hypothetical protein
MKVRSSSIGSLDKTDRKCLNKLYMTVKSSRRDRCVLTRQTRNVLTIQGICLDETEVWNLFDVTVKSRRAQRYIRMS